MQEKSHVSMGNFKCPVCNKIHERNACILLDTRLRSSLKRTTIMGLSPCEDHYKEGFILLIEAEKQGEGVNRLGGIVHIKTDAFKYLFPSMPIPKEDFGFIDKETFAQLIALTPKP